MNYKNIPQHTAQTLLKSAPEGSGCHDRYYILTDGAMLVSDSLTKLKFLKLLGLTTTPIYKYSKGAYRRKRYAVGVCQLLTCNGSGYNEDDFMFWRSVCGLCETPCTISEFIDNVYINELDDYRTDNLIQFLKKNYRMSDFIGSDFWPTNVLYCPITGYVFPYDCFNFSWMDDVNSKR